MIQSNLSKVAIAIIITLVATIFSDPKLASSEAYLAESVEAGILFMTSLVFFFQLPKCPNGFKSIALFFAMISFAFLLRELEPNEWGISGTLLWLLDDNGRYIFAIPLVAALVGIAMNIKQHFALIRFYLRSPFALWIYASMTFLIASWPFDKHVFSIEHSALIEESLELIGYCFFFYAAGILSTTLNKAINSH